MLIWYLCWRNMSKIFIILSILILSSCGFQLPDEHIEIEFDIKSTHNDKDPKKSE